MPTVDTATSEEVVAQKDLDWNPNEPAEGTRILEFRQSGDLYRIQIKDSQRFTYGPFAPGGKGNYGGGSDNALRIYEGANKDNQLAVFRNVESVRDVGVPMVKLIKKVKSNAQHESGAAGSKTESRVERDVEYQPL